MSCNFSSDDKTLDTRHRKWSHSLALALLLFIAGDTTPVAASTSSTAQSTKSVAEAEELKTIEVYDIDDTTFHLVTTVRLFSTINDGDYIDISTGDYAEMRDLIGAPGSKWEDYEIRKSGHDPETNSFYRTMPMHPPHYINYFKNDLELSMEMPLHKWLGPAGWKVIERLKNPKLSKITYFLTARGHYPEEVLEGLVSFQKKLSESLGIPITLPPIENIYCVGRSEDPAKEKSRVLSELLHSDEYRGFQVLNFYDDDQRNLVKANELKKSNKSNLKFHVIDVKKTQSCEARLQ